MNDLLNHRRVSELNRRRVFEEMVVYAVYDGDELAYIGATSHIGRRLRSHRSSTPWWRDGLRVAILKVGFTGPRQMWAAENQLIRQHEPINNVQGNPRYGKAAA